MSAQPFFGLDVGKHSLKIAQIVSEGKNKKLFAAGALPSAMGSILATDSDISATAQVIKKLLKDLKITATRVNMALPEGKIYTRVIEMPAISEEELASALKWEAEQYIPVPLEEVYMDWQVLAKIEKNGENKMEVLLSAAPKTLVNKYVKLTQAIGVEPISLEPETIACARSLIDASQSVTTLVANLGVEETSLSIVRGGLIAFTRTIASGGAAVSRAIASSFGLETVQAEEYKKTYGMEKDHFEGKLLEVIKPLLDVLVSEIQRAVAFYQNRRPDDIVRRLVLVGGPALLPGMGRYFTEVLGLETELADPWSKISFDRKLFPDLVANGPIFATVVGLALKDLP